MGKHWRVCELVRVFGRNYTFLESPRNSFFLPCRWCDDVCLLWTCHKPLLKDKMHLHGFLWTDLGLKCQSTAIALPNDQVKTYKLFSESYRIKKRSYYSILLITTCFGVKPFLNDAWNRDHLW